MYIIAVKFVEYQKPPYTIRKEDKVSSASRYIYHAKQEIKITDSIFFALQNPVNHLYFYYANLSMERQYYLWYRT